MEEKWSFVLTEASGIRSLDLARLLPGLHCSGRTECIRQLDPCLIPETVDAVICSVKEAEDAERVAASSACSILVLGEGEQVRERLPWAIANGFLCGSVTQFETLLPQLLASARRLRTLRAREHNLQRRLSDEKLVNRAKILLVTRLQMSETEAHRYIEKTAMDNAESRRAVSLRLIHTYEDDTSLFG